MAERSEKEKMIAGEMYNPLDPQLCDERATARKLVRLLNETTEDEYDKRIELFKQLVNYGEGSFIETPFRCDYGYNITFGEKFFANFNCVMLDVCPITIGKNVMFGPGVQLFTATHPIDPVERNSGREYAKPISIGDNVWIGGGAIVNPGVSIGDNTTIGSGSVVTRNIPSNVVAAGNPCRVIKHLNSAIDQHQQ